MHYNQTLNYKTLGHDGHVVTFQYPLKTDELDALIRLCPNIPYIALAVLTPFEPPRDGSNGPDRQYPTGWALAHLKNLYKVHDKSEFITTLRLVHSYILQGGDVRNPIGLFTYRLRQTCPVG